jgi:large subunit ribosomal protein L29
MKISEVRDMKTEELHGELDRLRRRLFDLRSQAVTENLQDPSLLTKTRRDIARIFTVLKERGEESIEQRQYHLESIASHRRS